jgi:flagellar protein FliL
MPNQPKTPPLIRSAAIFASPDAETMMSDKAKPEKPARGGKLQTILVAVVGIAVLGGGGAAAGYYVAGAGGAEHAPDPNQPQLVAREGVEAETRPPPGLANGGEPRIDPTRYTASYHTLENPFTSNLNESDAFVQLSLGVSTYYDVRVIDAVKAHEPAIRSAVLMQLSAADELMLARPEGRQQLQRDLTRVVNQVLRERTGFGGIDNVYFTSFVVQ